MTPEHQKRLSRSIRKHIRIEKKILREQLIVDRQYSQVWEATLRILRETQPDFDQEFGEYQKAIYDFLTAKVQIRLSQDHSTIEEKIINFKVNHPEIFQNQEAQKKVAPIFREIDNILKTKGPTFLAAI